MKKLYFVCCLQLLYVTQRAQDTFSILAFDSLTAEVGAAGASCVDLTGLGAPAADFIAELFPDSGAVMTQAAYLGTNQVNARARFRTGASPDSIIEWLKTHDVSSNPHIRQYGVVHRFWFGNHVAAFTGTNCTDFKNHITGPNYSIHGNILLGQQVLDSMEARFLRAEGDLACKLMAAMQGANMVGADSRCAGNNSSSLFAFLKVSLSTDTFGKPSLLLGLRTKSGAQIEPIDSLQKMFSAARTCTTETSNLPKHGSSGAGIFPNPVGKTLKFTGVPGEKSVFTVYDLAGRKLLSGYFTNAKEVFLGDAARGLYIVELRSGREHLKVKLILNE